MGFIPYSYDHGQPLPWEYHKCSGGSIAQGLCMAYAGGKLVKSAVPGYIAMCDMTGAPDGTLIPVVRLTAEAVFEAPLDAAAEGLVPGSKAGVSEDGLGISAGAAVKNIEIVDLDGTAKGDKCRCRFVG